MTTYCHHDAGRVMTIKLRLMGAERRYGRDRRVLDKGLDSRTGPELLADGCRIGATPYSTTRDEDYGRSNRRPAS